MKYRKYARLGLLLFLLSSPAQILFCAENHSIALSAKQQEWIKKHPVIRLGISGSPSPISFWSGSPLASHPSASPAFPAPPQESQDRSVVLPAEADSKNTPPLPPTAQHSSQISYFQPPPAPWNSFVPPISNNALVQVNSEQQDQFNGIVADYLKQISALTGLHFEVSLATFDNHQGLHNALVRGDIDLLPTVMLPHATPSSNPLRTESYIKVPVVIVTQKEVDYIADLRRLESMRVAGVLSIGRKLQQLRLPINLIQRGPAEGIRGVSTGKYDAFICELTGVSQVLSDMPLTNIKISGELPAPSLFAMEVTPQYPELVPILNTALAAIPQKNKNTIWKNWFRVEYETKLIDAPWVQTLLIGSALLIILAFIFVIFFQRRFKRIKMAVEALDPHLLSVRLDQNVVITEVTEAFCRATGFDCHDLVGQPLMALGSPVEDSLNSQGYIWETLQKGKHWRGEVKLIKKNGATMWVEAVVSPLRRKNDETNGYTAIYQDVSQRKYYENLAVRDELTGLYNRRYFNEIIPSLLNKAQKQGLVFALILLDVDNFKKYNDNYGHPAGDKVLSAIGSVLREHFQRHDDMVFRLGGEEFGAALLASAKETALCAQKILKRIHNLNIIHEHNPPGVVTVSVGVCTSDTQPGYDLDTMYKAADTSLYAAKTKGRNQVVLNDH